MQKQRRRRLQSYRRRIQSIERQHSRARARLILVLLAALSHLHVPAVRRCWTYPTVSLE